MALNTDHHPIDLINLCNQIDAFIEKSEDEWGSKSRAVLVDISNKLRAFAHSCDNALLEDIETIRRVAGDLDIGYFINSESKYSAIRGNIGGIVTRACDRILKRLPTTRPDNDGGIG